MPDWKAEVEGRLKDARLAPTREASIVEEVCQHLDDTYRDALAAGATEGEARSRTLIELDSSEALSRALNRIVKDVPSPESALPIGGGSTTLGLVEDLRVAARGLMKSRTFTSIAVLSLALGIGANTALFSLIDALLIRTLNVPEPDRLVFVRQIAMLGVSSKKMTNFPPPVFDAVRAQSAAVEDAMGFRSLDRAAVVIDGKLEPPRQVDRVSADFLRGLGVIPILGRTPEPSDGAVAVISHRLWQSRFEGAPDVLGRAAIVDGEVHTIIGVAPRDFRGVTVENATDIWVSSASPPASQQMIARLRLGVTIVQAEAALYLSFAGLAKDRPDVIPWSDQMRIEAAPAGHGFSTLRARYENSLLALGGLVSLVLLVTCANVANLLTLRHQARQRTFAVRMALGASRSRLIRYCLAECALVALMGGILALGFARAGVSILLAMLPLEAAPDGLAFQTDIRVLAFTGVISFVGTLLFGLTPALRATRFDPSVALRSGEASASPLGGMLGRGLMAAQVGFAVILLAGAGLFGQTLRNLASLDVGFKTDNLLQVTLDTAGAGYQRGQVGGLYRTVLEKVSAIPGVSSVAGIRNAVMQNSRTRRLMPLRGEPLGMDQAWDGVAVTASFFSTMGIETVRGRTFTEDDFAAKRMLVVVNESFAKRYFPNEDPVGLRVGARNDIEIVGIVRDARLADLRQKSDPMMYEMAPEEPDRVSGLVVRFSAPFAAVGPAIRETLRGIHPRLVVDVRTMKGEMDRSLARERLVAATSGFFGVLALLLASIGIYGVASSAVAQRTRDIGIRMALGARSAAVVRESLRGVARSLGAGLILGVGAAVIALRLANSLISDLLFGLTPTDAFNLLAASGVMALVAMGASFVPARRATTVNPLDVIRHE
jgi:predicted permease